MRLNIGLPFLVSAVQAVQYYESQGLKPIAVVRQLEQLGATPERIRMAFCRVRKLNKAKKLGRTACGNSLSSNGRTKMSKRLEVYSPQA
jgi:hypothetical protein